MKTLHVLPGIETTVYRVTVMIKTVVVYLCFDRWLGYNVKVDRCRYDSACYISYSLSTSIRFMFTAKR